MVILVIGPELKISQFFEPLNEFNPFPVDDDLLKLHSDRLFTFNWCLIFRVSFKLELDLGDLLLRVRLDEIKSFKSISKLEFFFLGQFFLGWFFFLTE